MDNKFPTVIFKPNWIGTALAKFEEHATRNAIMLEWGSGLSTIYLARKVLHVFAIEHNHLWFTKVQDWLIGLNITNVTLLHRPYPPEVSYINAPYEFNRHFDIIEIDGRHRNFCFDVALRLINENGIVIFDDINEEKYKPTREKFLIPPLVNRTQTFPGTPGGKATSITHIVNPKTY